MIPLADTLPPSSPVRVARSVSGSDSTASGTTATQPVSDVSASDTSAVRPVSDQSLSGTTQPVGEVSDSDTSKVRPVSDRSLSGTTATPSVGEVSASGATAVQSAIPATAAAHSDTSATVPAEHLGRSATSSAAPPAPVTATVAVPSPGVRLPVETPLPAADNPAADNLVSDTLATDPLATDSLRALSGSGSSPSPYPGYRRVEPRELFGAQSLAAPPAAPAPPEGPALASDALFQTFVLVLAATYALLVSRHLGDIRTLLGRISRDRTSSERLSEDPGSSGMSRFLNVTAALGLLFVGVATIRYGDALMPRALAEGAPRPAVLLLSLAASLLYALVAGYQASALRIAGAVTLSQPFVTQLLLVKRTCTTLAVMILSPPLLLFALCPRGTGDAWFYVIAIELLLTVLLYLKETLNLFISKKISILHWFLYLCTVEIFPFSLIWLLATRWSA